MPSKNFQLKSFTKFYKYFVGNLAALNFLEILFFFTSEKYL